MRRWRKYLYLLLTALLFVGTYTHVWAGEEEDWDREPAKVKILSQKSNATGRRYTIYWKEVEDASGYQVQLYRGKEKLTDKMLASSRVSYEFRGVYQSEIYRYRIRAYRKATNPHSDVVKTIYGEYHTGYLVQQPRVNFQWKNKTAVSASWTPVEDAVSYRVYLSTRRGSGYRRVARVKTPETVIKKLKLETNYYVYVIADYKVKKKTYSTPVNYSYPFRLQRK